MSFSNVAYSGFRHVCTGALVGLCGAILGNMMIDSSSDEKLLEKRNKTTVIFTVAIASMYLGISLGKEIGARWISSQIRWSIIKPVVELAVEMAAAVVTGSVVFQLNKKMNT